MGEMCFNIYSRHRHEQWRHRTWTCRICSVENLQKSSKESLIVRHGDIEPLSRHMFVYLVTGSTYYTSYVEDTHTRPALFSENCRELKPPGCPDSLCTYSIDHRHGVKGKLSILIKRNCPIIIPIRTCPITKRAKTLCCQPLPFRGIYIGNSSEAYKSNLASANFLQHSLFSSSQLSKASSADVLAFQNTLRLLENGFFIINS